MSAGSLQDAFFMAESLLGTQYLVPVQFQATSSWKNASPTHYTARVQLFCQVYDFHRNIQKIIRWWSKKKLVDF